MDLIDIAKSFDTTVRGLAKFLGYTTQGLYKATKRTPGTSAKRRREALMKMDHRNLHMYQEDLKRAETKRIERESAIRGLAELFQVKQRNKRCCDDFSCSDATLCKDDNCKACDYHRCEFCDHYDECRELGKLPGKEETEWES